MNNQSESIVKLTAALIKAKAEFEPLVRNAENPGFKRGNKVSKYADLEAVIDATEPALRTNGLILLQFPHSEGRSVGVLSILVHESGEFLEHAFAFPLTKEDAQTGSGAVTYARRVAMKSIFGLTDVDDDGNTATNNTGGNREAAKPKAAAPAVVPKSEIPKEPLGKSEKAKSAPSKQSPASTNSNLPTEAELKTFRKQFNALALTLENAEAGLVPATGNPVAKQLLAYLLQTTGAAKPDDITVGQYAIFFSVTDSTDVAELVKLVNAAQPKKK
jgi:hypothetical protein